MFGMGIFLFCLIVVPALGLMVFFSIFCELEDIREQCLQHVDRSKQVRRVVKNYDECRKLNIPVDELSTFVEKSMEGAYICGIPIKIIKKIPFFRKMYDEIIYYFVQWLDRRKYELPNGMFHKPEKLVGQAAYEFARLNKQYHRLLKNF